MDTWYKELDGYYRNKINYNMKKYLFYFEDEGFEGYHFTVHANNHNQAYDIAYQEYGHQVEDMIYKEISIKIKNV